MDPIGSEFGKDKGKKAKIVSTFYSPKLLDEPSRSTLLIALVGKVPDMP